MLIHHIDQLTTLSPDVIITLAPNLLEASVASLSASYGAW